MLNSQCILKVNILLYLEPDVVNVEIIFSNLCILIFEALNFLYY
jgi:hypothetical protein